ncbi:MFS transporter [Glacieibacterium sp.]|uniref:MFS transporter n=1 Tax=Glacieibacterium sp. TaxID=2860237 RepID=UPI003AFF7CBF
MNAAAVAPLSVPLPAARSANAGVYAWYVAILLSTAHLVSFIDRFLMSLVLEPLKADLGVSDTQLGLLQGTGFVILYTLVAVPLGRMADSVNRRNLIIAGILLWSIATALCGLANSFGSLFMARIGVGFGEAALVPAAMSLLAAYFPRQQLGRAVSVFTTGASLGKSAALIGGGAVLAALTLSGGISIPGLGQLQPWQGTFVLMAIPGIVLALILLTVREPARVDSGIVKPSIAVAFAHIRRYRRAYLTHTAAGTAVVMIIQSLAAWSPTFYIRIFHMTPPQAGLLVGSVILVAAPLGHLFGGFLTDLFQKRGAPAPAAPVMIAGLVCAIPAILVLGTTRSLPLSLAAYGVLNFGVTMGAPASLAGVQMLTPDRLRGVVSSMFLATVTLIGIGMGPPLIGFVTDTVFGTPLALDRSLMLVIPIVAVIGTVFALASRRPFQRAAATATSA